MNVERITVGYRWRTLLASCVGVGCLAFSSASWAQGVDELAAAKQSPNYVSDDMLLNADKDASNWLHYGRDYATTRYALAKQVNQNNVHRLVPKWQPQRK